MVSNYSINPVINGLSDHDAQVVTFHSLSLGPQIKKLCQLGRLLNLQYNLQSLEIKL
jgi:hypothetical protein